MTPFPPVREGAGDLISSIQLRDFDACWAGGTLGGRGFCFGSDDGRFLLTDHDGRPQDKPEPVVRGAEAINGIAFLDRRMAVSSRSEINIFTLPPERGAE